MGTILKVYESYPFNIEVLFHELEIFSRWHNVQLGAENFELYGDPITSNSCGEIRLNNSVCSTDHSCSHSDIRSVFISSKVGWVKVCHHCKKEM